MLTRQRLGLGIGLLLLAALPPLAALLDEPFYLDLASRILIFALAAVSLDLILGYGGMVSFGHAAFVGIGAYVVAILAQHGTESAWLAWPAAVLVAAGTAFLFGLVALRTSGVYFIMITLALAQMVYFFLSSLQDYGGSDGLALARRSTVGPIDLDDGATFYYLVLAILVATLGLAHRLVRSRFGMAIRGARENEARMQALGFPTFRYKLACFTLAGAIAGLAGALAANQSEFVSPSLLHWTRSGELIVMVLLGGMGTLVGPVVGAAALLLLEELLSSHTEHWMAILGPILILVVLFARRGLLGLVRGGP